MAPINPHFRAPIAHGSLAGGRFWGTMGLGTAQAQNGLRGLPLAAEGTPGNSVSPNSRLVLLGPPPGVSPLAEEDGMKYCNCDVGTCSDPGEENCANETAPAIANLRHALLRQGLTQEAVERFCNKMWESQVVVHLGLR